MRRLPSELHYDGSKVSARAPAPYPSPLGEGLTVTFNGVGEDSRCPTDVQCEWEGDAEVDITLSKPGFSPLNTVLHTTLTPKSVSYNGYTVALGDLDPDPVSTTTIDPDEYEATFTVTKP